MVSFQQKYINEYPTIAVLIPVFNRQNGLDSTLASLKQDTTLKLDIFIVDDGSDPPLFVPKDCGVHKIFLIRHEKNLGIVSALNTGLKKILKLEYEFVARIDADDTTIQGRFLKQLNFMLIHTDCGVLGSSTLIRDMKNNIIKYQIPPETPDEILKQMRRKNVMSHPSVLIRCQTLRDLGIYSEMFPAAEDYELFFRVGTSNKYTLYNLPEYLTNYIRSPGSISNIKYRSQLFSNLKIKLKYFDFKDIHSYLGIFSSNTIRLFIPLFILKLSKKIKAFLSSNNNHKLFQKAGGQ